nr:immunoglobulin heavy chain junction region [Mus musculus]
CARSASDYGLDYW